jgi:hypothetical protein
MEKALVTIQELSIIVSVKVPTLRKWQRQEDALPHLKIGRVLRFKLPDVLAWVDRQHQIHRLST